ncbi:MAG: ABC transporter permease subunit [Actinobacteria bacterium]|nr:ABC transporter permease subunit [Actinomycetota bacterium]
MNLNLLLGTLRQRRIGLFWFSFGLLAYSWVMIWYWSILGEEYFEMIEAMPPEMLVAFAGSADIEFGTLGSYFQVEYLGSGWIIIVAAAMIVYAAKAVASEIAAGTMELLIVQPIARIKFVLTRIVGLVIYAAVLTVASFAPIQIFGEQYNIELPGRTIALLYATGFLFVLTVGSFAFMLSSAMSSGGLPGAITGSLLVVMWILQAISQFAELADNLRPVNIFEYWQPGVLINDGVVSPEIWWVYGGATIVSLAIAVVVFLRRDLT